MLHLKVNITVNVHVYNLDVPVSSPDCTHYTPDIETRLSYSLISSEENGLPFLQLQPISTMNNFSFNQVFMTDGWTKAALNEKFAEHI